jgi:DNA-binding transcriptional regulator YiaG
MRDESMNEAGDLYHYTESGLDFVWLNSGFTRSTHLVYGECVAVTAINGLHRAICIELCCSERKLSGQEIRYLRKEIGLSQKDLGNMFGVEDQTIARWEKDLIPVTRGYELLLRAISLGAPVDMTEMTVFCATSAGAPNRLLLAYSNAEWIVTQPPTE